MGAEDDAPVIEDITDLTEEEVAEGELQAEPRFQPAEEFEGSRPGWTFKCGPEGLGYYKDDGKPSSSSITPWRGNEEGDSAPPKKTYTDLSRDGVPLTEDLIRRKAEHNEGMLSTLEEIALHQLDIDRIETLNNCRCLKIVYLQSNLIKKIEGLHRLKKLDYLNLALNNITKIENLQGCEELRKLDMTCNFIDLDQLHSIESLKNNTALRDLYFTGNPCVTHWESGYRDYVIATLPQIESLDGINVTKSERIKAVQRLPALQRELALLAPLAVDRREEMYAKRAEKKAAIARGDIEDDTCDEWCPETRVSDARELREIENEKEETRRKSQQEDPLFSSAPARKIRFFKDDGTPTQMNTAKWPFAIDDDGENITVDLALPKFLDSASIDADVQPTHVRVSAKKNHFQIALPAEVLADSSQAKRSATTGHLLFTCPKVHPIVRSKAPEVKKKEKAPAALAAPTAGKLTGPGGAGSQLKGTVDIRNIVADGPNATKKEEKQKESLGADWSDEEDVPELM